VITPTLNEIRELTREHFDYRINLHREMNVDYHSQKQLWAELRSEILRWCRDRFGPGALGIAVNRDEPGFLKYQTQFVNPEIARFEYDMDAGWISRGWMFWFKDENAAFEFKMRWKGMRVLPG
jgi:hypothetical protein